MKYVMVLLIGGMMFGGCSSQNGEKKDEIKQTESNISSHLEEKVKSDSLGAEDKELIKNSQKTLLKDGVLGEKFIQHMKDIAGK